MPGQPKRLAHISSYLSRPDCAGTFWEAYESGPHSSRANTCNARMPMKRPLLESSVEELKAWMTNRGHPGYHARQVFRWIFRHRAERFEAMSDLPKELRQQLDDEWTVFGTSVAHHYVGCDGTDKLLLECGDGRRVECVLMAEEDRRTVCISSTVTVL